MDIITKSCHVNVLLSKFFKFTIQCSRLTNTDEATVVDSLKVLKGRDLLKEMEPGKWVRKVLDNKSGKRHSHL